MEKETQHPPHPGSTDDAVRDEEAGSVFRREGGGRDEEVGATEAAVRRREKEGRPSVPAPPPAPAREDVKQSVSHDEERPPVPAPPPAPAEGDITGEKDVTQSVSHQEERPSVPAPPPAPPGEDVNQSVSHHVMDIDDAAGHDGPPRVRRLLSAIDLLNEIIATTGDDQHIRQTVDACVDGEGP